MVAAVRKPFSRRKRKTIIGTSAVRGAKWLTLVPLMAISIALADEGRVAPDFNGYCGAWASRGECARNPAFMLEECATSCAALEAAAKAEAAAREVAEREAEEKAAQAARATQAADAEVEGEVEEEMDLVTGGELPAGWDLARSAEEMDSLVGALLADAVAAAPRSALGEPDDRDELLKSDETTATATATASASTATAIADSSTVVGNPPSASAPTEEAAAPKRKQAANQAKRCANSLLDIEEELRNAAQKAGEEVGRTCFQEKEDLKQAHRDSMQRKKAECEERQQHFGSKVEVCNHQMEAVQADLKKCKAESRNRKCATEVTEAEIRAAKKVKQELLLSCEKDIKWEREVAVNAIAKAERKEWAHRGVAEREHKRAEDTERRLKEVLAASDCSAAERRNSQLQAEATAAEQGRLELETKFRQQTKAATRTEALLREELEEAKLRIEELEQELEQARHSKEASKASTLSMRPQRGTQEPGIPEILLSAQESWSLLENSTNQSSLARFQDSDDRHSEVETTKDEAADGDDRSEDEAGQPLSPSAQPPQAAIASEEEALLTTAHRLLERSALLLLDLFFGALDQVGVGSPARCAAEAVQEALARALEPLQPRAGWSTFTESFTEPYAKMANLRPTWLNSAEVLASLALHGATRSEDPARSSHEQWLPEPVDSRPEQLGHVLLASWLAFFVWFCCSRTHWLLTSGVPAVRKALRVPCGALDGLLERHFGLNEYSPSTLYGDLDQDEVGDKPQPQPQPQLATPKGVVED